MHSEAASISGTASSISSIVPKLAMPSTLPLRLAAATRRRASLPATGGTRWLRPALPTTAKARGVSGSGDQAEVVVACHRRQVLVAHDLADTDDGEVDAGHVGCLHGSGARVAGAGRVCAGGSGGGQRRFHFAPLAPGTGRGKAVFDD